ncbi:proline-rich receptor-like protein kinase PERK2 [Juglans microcarpa x Juglans regia]|uniref:proline-rich receptor-like protein kinase PERK2 n=1 Tax=Juglans microcarpa x Juglans regia TaxID=2249226 RepID=UPI001B7F315C|nr:proline-rich receptor-like protein kinase PERK2 [Juglans microcarpa x Juglans regia]
MSAPTPSPEINEYSPPPPPLTEGFSPVLPLPPPPPKGLIGLVMGIVMGVLIVLVAVGFCVIWRRKKRRRGDNNESDGLPRGAKAPQEELNQIPNHFKPPLLHHILQ